MREKIKAIVSKLKKIPSKIKFWFKNNLKSWLESMGIVSFILFIMYWFSIRANGWGFKVKTSWDFMEIILFPAALTLIGLWVNSSQKKVELKIAQEEREADREIALDRQRQSTLDNYFDKMTELILEKQLHTTEDENVRLLARSRTHNILRELDAGRTQQVIRFLNSANLNSDNGLLIEADLREADLSRTDLSEGHLTKAKLHKTNLSFTTLFKANLQRAHLTDAKLIGANLENVNLNESFCRKTDFSNANLKNADLSSADLRGAKFVQSTLYNAKLNQAFIMGVNLNRTDLREAKLHGADLRKSNLSNADLKRASLKNADLRDTNLTNANFGGADLSFAKLTGAKITTENLRILVENVYSLEGATMPNGQKFEEWQAEREAATPSAQSPSEPPQKLGAEKLP